MHLVKSQLPVLTQQRLFRLQADVRMLRTMTRDEVLTVYRELEWVRDELSRILDRADGKSI